MFRSVTYLTSPQPFRPGGLDEIFSKSSLRPRLLRAARRGRRPGPRGKKNELTK